MKIKYPIFCLLIALVLVSCEEEKKTPEDGIMPPKEISQSPEEVFVPLAPMFNPDSAYSFIKKQVDFGPRVPNTAPHKKCAAYLSRKLQSYGMEVLVQEGEVTAFNKKKLQIKNIIGQYNTDATNRILLFAHWDTRPFADRDTEKRNKPIDGANDGASGVGVLLEIARQLQTAANKPKIGIDIIFFDAEDYGQPHETMLPQQGATWCLGSQYWAKNPPIENYHPKYGILLDMVGAKNAIFPKETYSIYYASETVHYVWSIAQKLGYGAYFSNVATNGGITDDHLYVNEIARIPSINIIHYHPQLNDFGSFHHTHRDNMEIIDRKTLKAVGQTVLEVIYREK